MSDFETRKAVYYLESIGRNLKEFAEIVSAVPHLAHHIGMEILADNRDWLDCYVDVLRRGLDGNSAKSNDRPL
jgi:FtsZ-interacting cell division protein ZipA